jgi:serine/threonine protein kinase/formylglycine-generating enzyme required for sulfatase activity
MEAEPETPPRVPHPSSIEDLVAHCVTAWDREGADVVERLCAANPSLAGELRERLRALGRLGLLPANAAELRQIGPYRILRRIGEGGMGTVYEAEQLEPVRRTVALKIIRSGIDSERVLARFAAEKRTLALMEHGNVARIHDAGATQDGRPWFAMEHLRGQPLHRHCNDRRLTVRERLHLFLQACAGVQHAHLKGIVHRDLSPNNMLVVDEDGQARVKIIDFGLARAMGEDDVDVALTAPGQFVGTPGYASPEQTGLVDHDIDARTDIYSLGVVLYELLVDRLPFLAPEQSRVALHEVRRRICDEPPPRPSTQLVGPDSDPATAARRAIDPAALLRLLRNDFDWIVLKCLEKDPIDRYQSVAQLADDIERHLRCEPIAARPPNLGYRFRKFTRRNRLQVAAGAALLLAILGGTAATFLQYLAAESARVESQANLDRFRLVANVVQLDDARQLAAGLGEPVPDRIEAMEAWRRDQGEPLRGRLLALEAALAELRGRALPPTRAEIDADTRAHEKWPNLQKARQTMQAVLAETAVRAGGAAPTLPDPDERSRQLSARALNAIAWPLVDPRNRAFGEETRALSLARLANAKIAGGDSSIPACEMFDTLAWACHACGLDAEALRHSDEALEHASPDQRTDYETYRRRLQKSIESCQGEAAANALAKLRKTIAELEAEVAVRRHFSFADDTESFLHGTLQTLVAELRGFLDETGAFGQVEARLDWARRVEALTLSHPHAHVTWAEAREAIATADGIAANELYRAYPIDLAPQTGLVPIGKNPVTGLWEFYHLRSAWDPKSTPDPATLPIPAHDAEGRIAIGPETGIVFVLVPGGTFTMGAQRGDPSGPGYDPFIEEDDETDIVTLAPFFIARHELTQGQWARLAPGTAEPRWPSGYEVGGTFVGIGKVAANNPVESVSWAQADALLRTNGLVVPTEAQWEYACRSGTPTPWYCGAGPDSVAGHGNVLDRTADKLYPGWRAGGEMGEFEDGHAGPCPVGRFRMNGYGLHDVIGNVWEWCLDPRSGFNQAPAAGTGLRSRDRRRTGDDHIARGGCYSAGPRAARSGNRNHFSTELRDLKVGVRAARPIED